MRTFLRLRLSHSRPNPALSRVLPGGRCPLGTPSPAEAVCFGAGDDALSGRIENPFAALGSRVPPLGRRAEPGARGCSLLPETFPLCFSGIVPAGRARPAGATLGRVAKHQALPWTGRCFPRPGSAAEIRIHSDWFDFISALFQVRVGPAKTNGEFVKHPETLPWREAGLPAGCHSRRRITADGGDLRQPKPGWQPVPDHDNIRRLPHGA